MAKGHCVTTCYPADDACQHVERKSRAVPAIYERRKRRINRRNIDEGEEYRADDWRVVVLLGQSRIIDLMRAL